MDLGTAQTHMILCPVAGNRVCWLRLLTTTALVIFFFLFPLLVFGFVLFLSISSKKFNYLTP